MSQFVNDSDLEKPFHSNGFAEVTASGSIGSVSPQSFRERARIEQNRQAIANYRSSHLAQNRQQMYIQRNERSNDRQAGSISSSSRLNVNFREPKGRTYNPYS